jgi:hypothetical protein
MSAAADRLRGHPKRLFAGAGDSVCLTVDGAGASTASIAHAKQRQHLETSRPGRMVNLPA